MTQRYEIEAWLGDGHGLTDSQIRDLGRVADEIEERYPEPDDADDREAALTTAYRLLMQDGDTVVRELAADLLAARVADRRARVALRQAAMVLVREGGRGVESQAGFATAAGVDRMAVRDWLGLR